MRIVFIGNFDSVPYTTENHHRKTFEKLGHTVIRIQENKSSVQEVLNVLDGADMLYWTNTHSFHLDSDERIKFMLAECKRKNIPSVGFHLDLFLGIEREKTLHTNPYWNIQHFFTVDKLFALWLNENTQTKGYYLPAGVFEDECYLAEPNREKYPHEIIFVGSRGYHKEWPYREKLIQWLYNTYGNRFAQYGGGGLPTIRGHELNVLYASAKVVVGDSLCKDFNYPYYLSDRIFETTGRGGFIIFPDIKGIEDLFDLNSDLILYQFGDFDSLERKINTALNNPELVDKIRISGYERTKNNHTYTHRIQSLLKTLSL